jgi:hypothetical protein
MPPKQPKPEVSDEILECLQPVVAEFLACTLVDVRYGEQMARVAVMIQERRALNAGRSAPTRATR